MSITVEHEKRKREILERALDVFVDEGYEDTTFQKIAERCGITRTILYLYFKNKREIFSFSIKLFTEKLEAEVRAIGADPARPQAEKISLIIAMVVDICSKNRRLLAVVLDYLGHIRASGGNPDERVRRRTIRMRHILSGILIEGQKKGEFGRFPVKAADDLIYALIEAAIFRIAVLGRDDAEGLASAATLFASGLRLGSEQGLRPGPRTGQGKEAAAQAAEPPPRLAGTRQAAEGRGGRSGSRSSSAAGQARP